MDYRLLIVPLAISIIIMIKGNLECVLALKIDQILSISKFGRYFVEISVQDQRRFLLQEEVEVVEMEVEEVVVEEVVDEVEVVVVVVVQLSKKKVEDYGQIQQFGQMVPSHKKEIM